tara:strand:- start:4953 stop:6104 length:1152 start_codon:yes stop_codon:yes gene_type:complete
MKILAVTGIRSDYDIIYPVLKELEKNHNVMVAVSGAHLSDNFSNTYKLIESDNFDIVDKIDTLISTDRTVQRAKGAGLLIQGLSQTVERTDPDILIMLGDREESIATAIVGNYMEKLVVHIGGGDTVYGNADDPMRFAVSKLSHLHCCTAESYAQNLINIGEEDFRVFFTGNPAFVNIKNTKSISKNKLFKKLRFSNNNYIVLINHPLSSELIDTKEQTELLLSALKIFCLKNNYHTICIPPNSDPGSHDIKRIINEYDTESWFVKLETQPRDIFINLIRNAKTLIGNSSMGILEAPFYKLPVINVGNRQKGRLNAGNVKFISHDESQIIEALNRACLNSAYRSKISKLINPFGDENSAINIKNAIESINLSDRKWYIKRKLC